MKRALKHSTSKKISNGKSDALGAVMASRGVNFALYSKNADAIFLLLFDDVGGPATDTIALSRTKDIWHVCVQELKAGQLYGYKARGPYDPAQGLRFNENKFLLDPYAKAISGKVRNHDKLLFGYNAQSDIKDLSFDDRDSTEIMPRCVVVDDAFDWHKDTPPSIPWDETIIYEAHLKGFTAHVSSGVKYPGTYLGFIEKIPHLKSLGITAVEFMPLQEFYSEDFLVEKKLVNYWGYNTIGFFAPESSYAAHASGGAQVKEFKILVAALHKAGIEVILDVVYNHSGEGWELGPTICFRGIDNLSYYPLHGGALEPKRFYVNHSGCGNCLDASHPAVVRLIVDSLRYWVDVMHVDGFRFDLATVLGRVDGQFNKNSPVFTAIIKDPVLKKVKLIAEPWDLKGSELGHFAREWSELNGRFRDTVRRFGKEQAGVLNDLKNCLVGSPDIFGSDQECAHKSINFVTNHDGFTLRDLVSYERKHNEANLENNRDGSEHNDSWNCGVEGATDDLGILNLRLKLAKNYMCVLLLSSGIPMILGGDEFLRTQQGNNNAYCQDDEISWFDWNLLEKNRPFFNFCQSVFGLMPTFKKTTFKEKFLYAAGEHCLSRFLHASKENSSFFIIFNAGHETQYMHLPKLAAPRRWRRKIDTSLSSKEDFAADGREIVLEPAGFYIANPCSSVVLIG